MLQGKCDGARPTCEACRLHKEECVYDKAPSMSYALSLGKRVVELETLLSRLKDANDAERAVLLQHYKTAPSINYVGTDHLIRHGSSSDSDDVQLSSITSELTVDDEGQILYYGSTSVLLPPPPHSDAAVPRPDDIHDDDNSALDSTFNASPLVYAALRSSFSDNVDPDLAETLLRYHFCWVQPMLSFSFTSTNDPPILTEYLLNILFAQASRFTEDPRTRSNPYDSATAGDPFLEFIKQHFVHVVLEGNQKPSVSLVQAFVLHGATELARGNLSRGWLLTGLGFRVMSDMGLHLDAEKMSGTGHHFSSMEAQQRRRTFWSCYIWDKCLSLYLGRLPSIQDSNVSPSLNFTADAADDEMWVPYYGPTDVKPELPPFKPTPSHQRTYFIHFAKLMRIVNKILITVYAKPQTAISPSEQSHNLGLHKVIRLLSDEVRIWKHDLPDCLWITATSLPAPNHIFTVK